MRFLRRMSLVPKGLRYKLLIAFCLMSIIPLLVSAYLARGYIFNVFMAIFEGGAPSGEIITVSWIFFFCIALVFLGLTLAKQMIEPVIEMALEAKLIADGDLTRRISVEREDEIGGLGHSINQLTCRIRGDMEELKTFGEKTKKINIEINRRVLALSSLLQIGENISVLGQMEDVMTLIVEKIVQLMDVGYAALFLLKVRGSDSLEYNIAYHVDNEILSQLEIKIGKGVLGKALVEDKVIYADSKTKSSREVKDLQNDLRLKNFAAFSIISRSRIIGMLLVGNEIEDFEFKYDDIELIKVFAKQAAIAYESDELAQKTKELAIKDELTDLFNQKYIVTRLDEEIKRAIFYQRPCSYIQFNVDDFDKFRKEHGELAIEKAIMKVASILKESVPQVGRAARLSGYEFALLLPEKNKKEAYRIAEEVRKKVESIDLQLEKETRLTVTGGVSENPLDGSTAEELMKKAANSISMGKSQGKNRIV